MEKKTKLTISGSAKKSIKNIEIAKTQSKNAVVIEKQTGKFPTRGGSFRPSPGRPKPTSSFNRGAGIKPSFATKSPPITNDFERRKLAEQRATKRLKGDGDGKDKKTLKSGTKKRELKLTVSRALSDEIEARERNFIIEDTFQYDTEVDDERDIKKKKLAYKEEIAKAKNYLEGLKTKYYDEIKLRPGITQDQQKATDFFNRYNEEQKVRTASHERFVSKTKNLLNEEFKGFDFKLGEKKFRYGIKDPSSVAKSQSDISNFIKTFLNDKGEITDTTGYHKALFAARNADTIANHFYEQGKTDAIKNQLAQSKNINTEPRKTAPGEMFVGGLKVKAISGIDSSKLKIKRKTFN